MRTSPAAALAFCLPLAFCLLCHSPTAKAQTPPLTNGVPVVAQQSDMRPIVIGLGAIAGVVAFNVLVLGIDALPGGMAYAPGAVVPAEMSVAMSRVYATTAAVVGGWIGYFSSER